MGTDFTKDNIFVTKLQVNGGGEVGIIGASETQFGVDGISTNNSGVSGFSTNATGVSGTGYDGVKGSSSRVAGYGVWGTNTAGGDAGHFSGRLGVVGGPSWTNAQWADSVYLANASAIGWYPNATNSSYGIGHSTGGMYFFRATSAPGVSTGTVVYNMMITDNDLVGIGTVTPDSTLTVNGGASKPGGGSWGVYSDVRLKNIKGAFSPGLNAVLHLHPIRYEYKKDNALGLRSEGEHVGFSAQEVEKVIPEAITKNDRGYRIVNNDPILWTMLNAIKEQQTEIKGNRRKLADQANQLDRQRLLNLELHSNVEALKTLVCRSHRRAAVCKK